ncbi:hypothetical protein ACOSQ2_002487 [Xanthoceras sorbifolium]
MADFKISRAALLNQTVLELRKLAGPGHTTTFNFCPEGVSLLASSPDGNLIGALRINRESYFICNQRFSLGVNLNQLCNILNLADDEDFVRVTTCEASCQFVFDIRSNVDGHKICRHIEFIKPNPMHVILDLMPQQYVVKTGIATPIFTGLFFSGFRVDEKVAIIMTNKNVELITGAATLHLSPEERDECIIQGIKEDDDGSYLAEFNSQAFYFHGAFLLKKTASHLKKLAEPGDTATCYFSPKGISLLASSQDDQVIGALRFYLGSLSRFICNHPHSLGVNLDQLLTVLDLADDEDSVHIGASEELCQFIFRIRNLVKSRWEDRFHVHEGLQLFHNLNHFRKTLREYVVQEGFQIRRIKNENDRYTAECAFEVALLNALEPNPNAPSKFQRFFVNFAAQKQGFLFGFRPFICLDSCHLKGKYPGILLAANAIDANFGVFPLAVAIVDTECKESWVWFMRNLYEHIGEDNRRISFITDRQKGVIDALQTWWPGSSHRFCVRHIFANLRAKHRGNTSADLLFMAAKSTNKAEFDNAMKEMKDADLNVYNYMTNIPVCHWSRHAFDGLVKSDHVTNNISKAFNSWIDKIRAKPALTLLEELRRSFMNCIHRRHEEAKKWKTEIPPGVLAKLTINQDAVRYVQSLTNPYGLRCHSTKCFLLTGKISLADPKKNRKRGADEAAKKKRSNVAKCGACRAFGHNVRSCKEKRETAKGKNKAVGTIMGKRKIYVGSSSNMNQKKKKTSQANCASLQPLPSTRTPSQPTNLSSQPLPSTGRPARLLPTSAPRGQPLASPQPLSQNATQSQSTVGRAVPGKVPVFTLLFFLFN